MVYFQALMIISVFLMEATAMDFIRFKKILAASFPRWLFPTFL